MASRGRGRGYLVRNPMLERPSNLVQPAEKYLPNGSTSKENNENNTDKESQSQSLDLELEKVQNSDFRGRLMTLKNNDQLEPAQVVSVFKYLIDQKPTYARIRVVMSDVFEFIKSNHVHTSALCQGLYITFKHKVMGNTLFQSFFEYLEDCSKDMKALMLRKGLVAVSRYVLFFSSVCHYIRDINRPPFEELVQTLHSMIKFLCGYVSITHVECIKCLTLATVRYHSYVKDNPDIAEDGCSILRSVCFQRGVTPQTLKWLLLGVEVCLMNKLTESSYDYYKKLLGPTVDHFNINIKPVIIPLDLKNSYDLNNLSYKIVYA